MRNIYKKDGVYWLNFHFMGRRRRKRIGPNLTQARAVLAKIRVQIAENRYLDVKKESPISLKEMSDLFLETYSKPNKRSWRDDQTILRNINQRFGDIRLSRITSQRIEEYKATRKTEVSGARVNRELICLKTMFNKAITWGKGTKNPVKGIKFFPESEGRVRFLEKGEWEVLKDSCPPFLLPIIQVGFHSGMRQGEILQLRWDDIDFDRCLIHVRHSKSGYGRYVPINKTLYETLRGLKPDMDSPYLFPDKDGGPMTRFGRLRVAFNKVVNQSGIRDFHFHDLRHTFASQLVMAGVGLRTVGELLGHRSGFKMTMRYSHLSPAHKLDAVQRLDEKFGEQTDTKTDTNPFSVHPEKYSTIVNPSLVSRNFPSIGQVAERSNAPDCKSGGLRPT